MPVCVASISSRRGHGACAAIYRWVVKSISLAELSPVPAAFEFSVAARSQVHSPAGRAWHEQRAPEVLFSVEALSQVHWSADFLPHEQVACLATTC